MNIAICTDQKDYLNLIERKIKECYHGKLRKKIYRFTKRNNLMYSLRFRDYQLFYVEFSMQNNTGKRIADAISKRLPFCKVVLIVDEQTAQSDIVRNAGYEYIIRPLNTEDFNRILTEAIDVERSKPEEFSVYLNYKETQIFNTNDIKYVESYYHKVTLVTHDDVHKCCSDQKRVIYKHLLPRHFLRVNQSVLVNMKDIDFLTDKNCILKTREVFNTSGIHIHDIHRQYDNFKNNKNNGGKYN